MCKKRLWLVVAIAVLAIACIGIYIASNVVPWRVSTEQLDVGKAQKTPKVVERPLLKTIHMLPSTRDHLLDGNFKILSKEDAIPAECRSAFYSSFSPSGIGQLEEFKLADPGQPYQASDALVPGLPFRRLVFAGQQAGRCFVYYKHGGVTNPSYCVAVIDISTNKLLWVGRSFEEASGVQKLRAMLRSGKFQDERGLVC